MQNFKLKRLALAICMASLPYTAIAAGLGKLNVMSSLGEPLKADIELLSATPEELSSINAVIASNEAYESQGIEKPQSHFDIKIEVGKNAKGLPVLKLKSTQPVTDAFLDMLIDVNWSTGRLLREYTILLDPPGYASTASDTVSSPVTSAVTSADATQNLPPLEEKQVVAEPVQPVKRATSAKKSEGSTQPAPAEESLPPLQESVYDDSVSHMTVRGDSLSKVAQSVKPQDVSLEQMLVGLFRANPEAFDGENMNRLKVGKILRLPTTEELQQITRKEAREEVKVQSKNWNEYKNRLAGIVESAAPAEDAGASQTSSGKVITAEDQSKPVSDAPKDVVKLSAGDLAERKALEDKVAALQEDAIAKENALKEAQSRAVDLEKQLDDMQKLLALKNDAMSKLQTEASQKPAPQADVSPTPAEPVKQSTVPENKPKEVAAVKTKPQPNPKPAMPEPVPAPSMLDTFMQGLDVVTLGAAGGGLALLAGFWLYLRNKRKKNLASFEEGIMTSGGLKANTVFGNTAGGTVDTGDTSFLTDFSQSTAGGMIDAHDVDPIAEAEVYMAYGRDAQAEEILKDAIVKEPKRYELHLKLLEIYTENGNNSAFEAIAGELYTTLGADDPVWKQVAQLGLRIDPTNPLYQIAESSEPSETSLDATLTVSEPVGLQSEVSPVTESFGEYAPGEMDVPDTLTQQTIPETATQQSDFDADFGTLEFDMDTPGESSNDVTALPSSEDDFKDDQASDLVMDDVISSETKAIDADEEIADLNLDDLNPSTLDFGENVPNSLDVPTLDFPALEDAPIEDMSSSLTTNELNEDLTLSLDDESSGVKSMENEASGVLSENALNLEGITLELDESPTMQSDAPLSMSADNETVDFSGIDLNLDDDVSTELDVNDTLEMQETSDTLQAPEVSDEVEPEEVETKLDLVMAYLDMEDKIGAKELLDEVMKEGGNKQRQRASELLAKIS